MVKLLRLAKRRLLSVPDWKLRLVFWGGAITVGGISTLFAVASEMANGLFRRLLEISDYLPLLITPIGLMAVAWLTQRFFPGAEGSGIPQTMAALRAHKDHAMQRRILSLRIALGKIALTLVGLTAGASIGREGPTVHIGAAIMHTLGYLVKFPPHYMQRGLILAGGAAGVAAAFNTPLAGIVFVVEEMGRSFTRRNTSVVLTAVIAAGLTAIAVLGNYSYFGTTDAVVELHEAWLVAPVCGVAGGLLGGVFSVSLIWLGSKIGPWLHRYPLRVAALCGLTVASIGLLSGGHTYGTGYTEAYTLLSAQGEVLYAYPVLKLLATMASYLSGIPGGIFAPSLATGAGLGADLAWLFPNVPVTVAIVLGMVAYFAGVVQTPITAFVIVMEMIRSQDMIIPLMVCAFIGAGTSRLICHKPLYEALAENFMHQLSRRMRVSHRPAGPPPTEQPLPADRNDR